MEPEVPLSCLQDPSTGPYPERDEVSPCFQRSILISSSLCALVL